MHVSQRFEDLLGKADEEARTAKKNAGPNGDKARRMAELYLKTAELEYTRVAYDRLEKRVAALEKALRKALGVDEEPEPFSGTPTADELEDTDGF